jgi:5'(3')-deoxyribonucleotidase
MKRPLLIWDIDDVLNDLIRLCISTTAQTIRPGIRFEDLQQNPPLQELGCSLDEYRSILDECRAEYLYDQPPRKEVLEFFQTWGDQFRSVTLSSAPVSTAHRSAEWVLRHFGRWIHGTIFVPSPRKHIPIGIPLFASKAEAVSTLNGILIDDMPQNVEPVRAAGNKAFYFPAPWNENKNMSVEKFFSMLCKELELEK